MSVGKQSPSREHYLGGEMELTAVKIHQELIVPEDHRHYAHQSDIADNVTGASEVVANTV